MNLYEYTDYKAYLTSRLARGEQRQLATYIRCQPAFLSQVLRRQPHLSLEQGLLASEYFKMDASEQEYFMLALEFGRSGSEKLSKYYSEKMKKIREQHRRVESKIGKFDILDPSYKTIFYSSWKYAVVHVILSLPAVNQFELIKSKTGLSEREVTKVVNFLKTAGLIKLQSGKWLPTKRRIHLGPEDNLIGTHHRNFRSLISAQLEDLKPDSLHFSSALAISHADCEKIKNLLLDAIAKSEAILKPSQEETVRILCLDFFDLS